MENWRTGLVIQVTLFCQQSLANQFIQYLEEPYNCRLCLYKFQTGSDRWQLSKMDCFFFQFSLNDQKFYNTSQYPLEITQGGKITCKPYYKQKDTMIVKEETLLMNEKLRYFVITMRKKFIPLVQCCPFWNKHNVVLLQSAQPTHVCYRVPWRTSIFDLPPYLMGYAFGLVVFILPLQLFLDVP